MINAPEPTCDSVPSEVICHTSNEIKADRRRRIEIFLRMLERQEECLDFDPFTFVALVDRVVVGKDKELVYCFRNGMMKYTVDFK